MVALRRLCSFTYTVKSSWPVCIAGSGEWIANCSFLSKETDLLSAGRAAPPFTPSKELRNYGISVLAERSP